MKAKREDKQRRLAAFRQSVDRVLVVCGGRVTEPTYFVKIVVKSAGLSPASLVEYAVSMRDRLPDSFDQVWCVIDVDHFDLTEVISLADRNSIKLAVSNPCFEV